MNHIGQYIKILRESKGYSQRKLEMLSGIDHSTISRIEKGKTRPLPQTLSCLAEYLGTTVEELLKEAGYLNFGHINSKNIQLIREKLGMSYGKLSEKIRNETGTHISPSVLKKIEEGENVDLDDKTIYSIAKGFGVGKAFLFRQNTGSDLDYEIKRMKPVLQRQNIKEAGIDTFKDAALREWLKSPKSKDYIVFAKQLFDMGIDPDFIKTEFIDKIFRNKQ